MACISTAGSGLGGAQDKIPSVRPKHKPSNFSDELSGVQCFVPPVSEDTPIDGTTQLDEAVRPKGVTKAVKAAMVGKPGTPASVRDNLDAEINQLIFESQQMRSSSPSVEISLGLHARGYSRQGLDDGGLSRAGSPSRTARMNMEGGGLSDYDAWKFSNHQGGGDGISGSRTNSRPQSRQQSKQGLRSRPASQQGGKAQNDRQDAFQREGSIELLEATGAVNFQEVLNMNDEDDEDVVLQAYAALLDVESPKRLSQRNKDAAALSPSGDSAGHSLSAFSTAQIARSITSPSFAPRSPFTASVYGVGESQFSQLEHQDEDDAVRIQLTLEGKQSSGPPDQTGSSPPVSPSPPSGPSGTVVSPKVSGPKIRDADLLHLDFDGETFFLVFLHISFLEQENKNAHGHIDAH